MNLCFAKGLFDNQNPLSEKKGSFKNNLERELCYLQTYEVSHSFHSAERTKSVLGIATEHLREKAFSDQRNLKIIF